MSVRRYLGLLASCVALWVLGGCAQKQALSTRELALNPAMEAAERLERRGSTAYHKGDLAGALKDYQTASHVYESLALTAPFAIAQLNLARIDADMGKTNDALARVVQVLQALQTTDRSPTTGDRSAVDGSTLGLAHGRAAALHVQLQNWQAAGQHLALAESICEGRCDAASALHSLRARLQLQAGDLNAARLSATQALERATNMADKANALRSRAQIGLAGTVVAATTALDAASLLSDAQQALKLDQALGQSARVIADLELLIRISAYAKDASGERAYQALLARARLASQQLGAQLGAP